MENSPASEERSHSPLFVDALSEVGLEAVLDVFYRRVADPRIEEQQATIVRLQQELAQKDEILEKELAKKDAIIAKMKHGHGLCVRDILEDYRNPLGRVRLDKSFYDMKLDRFLMLFALLWEHLNAAQDVFKARC